MVLENIHLWPQPARSAEVQPTEHSRDEVRTKHLLNRYSLLCPRWRTGWSRGSMPARPILTGYVLDVFLHCRAIP